jgi:murein DD-endopeptidase MepM/ murein hydrolase activator NlpD
VRTTQNTLLTETKNKESEYQALIAQKKAEQASFEAELIRLASGLGTADTTSAPKPGKGIVGWPLSSVTITQNFGNTSFAASGAYNGSGHNGIDFRAAVGTPVFSVLGGTVQEVNQGAVKYCQYGKWVLVRHDNGLTSLYAHLSSISVAKGARVAAGQTVGLAGDTGYATGPHLHLTLYVSSAVTFKQYTCNSGAVAFIPIAPLNAYLNPLSYLPSL